MLEVQTAFREAEKMYQDHLENNNVTLINEI